nr:integrase, catalytic region, zinc finger, CCHC-type, peptidase aspartic, catalytic [Tanacetum cinerariifolium]
MGTVWEPLAEGTEGAPHLGPERPRVYSDLSPEEKDRYNADIRATNILLQGLPKDIYTLINHYTDANDTWDNHKGETIHDYYVRFAKLINDMRNIKMTMSKMQLNSKFVNNMLPEWGRFATTVKLNRGLRDSNYDQLGQGTNPWGGGAAGYGGVQNRVGNANPGQARLVKCYNCNDIGHIARNCTQPKRLQNFDYYKDKMLLMQAHKNRVALDEEQLLFLAGGQETAIDKDVDEQTVHDLALNVDNVFQVDDCNAFDSDVDEAPTAQTMFMANLSSADPVNDEARPSYDLDILSEYVKDNAVPVVHIVENSLTAELATYKEQVELYERRGRFELTEREQKINEQLRLVISDRNFKEETLKKELHYVKLQLDSTINHNKLMVEEVTSMKKNFKQKENKYLEDFLDMKSLNEKFKDRLFKQDRSLQTVHMLCRPNPYYNELNKVAIGYKNPLCLTRAKQVQPALYNGHEIIKDNHVPTIMHNTEDTLEIADITRRKMNDKMKDPECVTHKMKSKALREQTTVSRPIKALTVYPPNTPATLVPRVLPTNSQVKIHIFTLIQLFLEFNKTCKKRITPTGLTKRERGFEQTKACYLKEVIPFFQTLKENFEGIQKALTKEIKEMKDVFEELEAEVAQNVVDRKLDEIERKNFLIANDNLITEYLTKEVFSVATNSELNVARFTKMHVANTIVETRCLELEAELSNLSSLQGKDNVIRQLKKQISHLQEIRSDTDRTLKVKAIDSQITQLTKNVTVLQAQNDSFRTENDKIKQHYKEFVSKEHVKPKVLAPGKYAIDVEPIVPRLRNNKEAHIDYLRHLKESVETIRDIVDEAKVVVQIVLWYLDSGCSKHMTGDRSQLMNFMKKFIGTVRFRNDHFGAIMVYGDYVIGDNVISKVYYVKGLGHNLFFVEQFCDSDLEVAFRKHSCYVRDTDGVELIKGSDIGIYIGYAPSWKAYRIYNKRTRRIMETIHVQFDELTEPMDPMHLSTRPAPIFLTHIQITIQAPVNSAGKPSSTTIDQDAPSPSISPSSSALQSHQGIATE